MKNRVKHKCPVCGRSDFPEWNSFEICEECGWEDDGGQEGYPDDDAGANGISLNQYRADYESGWRPEWLLEIKSEKEMDDT